MDQFPPFVCPVNHGMNMIYFSICKNATAYCDEFYPCVAIWAFQYSSSFCLILGPKCEALKDIIFGFVPSNSDKMSSMLSHSINIFGCRSDWRVDGIQERRFFFVVLRMGDFFLS
jgi:hypothetical protein